MDLSNTSKCAERISPIYEEKLKSWPLSRQHSDSLTVESPNVFKAHHGDATLFVDLQQSSTEVAGLVKSATHHGFHGELETLMDVFCHLLLGRPIQEGAEHGTLRLEAYLRSESPAASSHGLHTPETAGSHFEVPKRLIRQIYETFLKTDCHQPRRNFWRDPLPQWWITLSPEKRVECIQSALIESCRQLDVSSIAPQVCRIVNDTRIVVTPPSKARAEFGNKMIRIEHKLNSLLGYEFELLLEPRNDRNQRTIRTKRGLEVNP